MTAQPPPPPGSVWLNKGTKKPMRVIYSADYEIIAHDAERWDKIPEITSWRGNVHHFNAAFVPTDYRHYPETAGK